MAEVWACAPLFTLHALFVVNFNATFAKLWLRKLDDNIITRGMQGKTSLCYMWVKSSAPILISLPRSAIIICSNF